MDTGHLDFHEIYAQYQPRILGYLARMVDESEAEDLTQEVFAKVANSLPDFRGDSQLSTWIYRIATNTALDRLRGLPGTPDIQLADAGEEVPGKNVWTGEQEPAVESQVYRKEMNDCIRGFVARLPENYRMVLVLGEFEGLKNEQVAEILGLTIDTVKIRLHRGRERLKAELAANCGPEWVEGNEFLPELK
jgi:RNA polymerase sigma-70 factor (ECF subfamily)